jgi:hypothetical protein
MAGLLDRLLNWATSGITPEDIRKKGGVGETMGKIGQALDPAATERGKNARPGNGQPNPCEIGQLTPCAPSSPAPPSKGIER